MENASPHRDNGIRLKRQILLPFSLACACLFLFSLFSIYREENEHIDRDFLSTVAAAQKIYDELQQSHQRTLSVAMEFVLQDKPLKTAYRSGNRETLFMTALPVFEKLRHDQSITHFYFMDPGRKNFLRVHQPERHGEIINRFTILGAEKTGGMVSGIEFGPLGTFTLRTVAPWREGNELLGYIELGSDLDYLVGELALMLNARFSLIVSKQYLDRDGWERGMRMLERKGDWDQLSDVVVSYHSGGDLPTEVLREIRIPTWDEPVRLRSDTIGDTLYRSAIYPLKDAGGRVVGGMLLTKDVSRRMAGTWHTIWLISAIAVTVGLSLFFFFYKRLGQIERQLESRELRVLEETQARLSMQEAHVRELEQTTLYDALTGLPNRTLLEERIGEAIGACGSEGQGFTLFLVDVDRLREINDTLGHEIGDRLLRQVAAMLRESLREADTIARLTGGEFALLVPAMKADETSSLVEKIARLFGRSFEIDGTSLTVGVRVGIVVFPEHGNTASVLLRHADVALHQAKRMKTMEATYDQSMDPFSKRRLKLIHDLRKAISGHELKLHYQPQLDSASGKVLGVEALARWHHPEEGPISPLEFIGLAENCGLIGPLTDWVLNEAVRQCREWEQNGLVINISVNVSAHSLMDATFPDKVAGILARWRIPAERLILEVTESVFMLETDHSLRVLDALRDMGLQLSIDDFGTGYSSLAYLKRMPVHELKIDQNFVRDMLTSTSDANIVASTVALAHGLGMKIVAEGVETEEVWRNLQAMGCDVVQGYHFSRPVSPPDLLEWIKKAVSRPSDPEAGGTS